MDVPLITLGRQKHMLALASLKVSDHFKHLQIVAVVFITLSSEVYQRPCGSVEECLLRWMDSLHSNCISITGI
jgi:hypothetical protein